MLSRKRVRADEPVPLELNRQECQLIVEYADPDFIGGRLPEPNEPSIVQLNLDEWEDLAGFVAAEANHSKNWKLQEELDRLYDRIDNLLRYHEIDDAV